MRGRIFETDGNVFTGDSHALRSWSKEHASRRRRWLANTGIDLEPMISETRPPSLDDKPREKERGRVVESVPASGP